MSEALPKNGVNPTSIQGIMQDEVVFHVVTNVVAINMSQMWLKMLGLEINQQISIPRISSANKE